MEEVVLDGILGRQRNFKKASVSIDLVSRVLNIWIAFDYYSINNFLTKYLLILFTIVDNDIL